MPMKRNAWLFTALMVLLCTLGIPRICTAGYSGRFDAAGYGSYPDDDFFEDRTVVATRFQFTWLDDASGDWRFHTRFRLKEELETESDGVRLQIWDFRLDYGLNSRFLGGSAGLCHLSEAPGTGTVLGIHLKLNPAKWMSAGVFGGMNPVAEEGITDVDGVKGGAYLTIGETWARHASIAVIAIGDRDDPALEDTQTYTTAEITYRWKQIFSTYHSAEMDWADPQSDLRLTYYYGRIKLQPLKPLRFSLDYHHFHQIPHLQFNDQFTGDEDLMFKEYYGRSGSGYRTWSVTPGLDVMMGKNWRLYARYRHRETDYFGGDSSDRYSAGVACHDLWNTGFYTDVAVILHRREHGKDTESGRFEIGRDFRDLNISMSYTGDRYWYGENTDEYEPREDTHRAGITTHYRVTRSLSLLLDIERVFGDEEDTFVLMNLQYRF